jgi:hypothetical protein
MAHDTMRKNLKLDTQIMGNRFCIKLLACVFGSSLLLASGCSWRGQTESSKNQGVAPDIAHEEITDEQKISCNNFAEKNGIYMELRQKSVSYESVREELQLMSGDNSTKQVLISLLDQAYSVPVLESEQQKKDVVKKFISFQYDNCISFFKKTPKP